MHNQKSPTEAFIQKRPLAFSLPVYDKAILRLINDVKEGLVSVDPILGEVQSFSIVHGGVTRQVSEPQVHETPMKEFSTEITLDLNCFHNTDVEAFRDFIWRFCHTAMAEMKRHLFQVVGETCDVTGNSFSAAGRDFWEAHIEMLETIDMHFDEDGNHNYRFYSHPDQKNNIGEPTEKQRLQIEKIFHRKRTEFYAQKRTRRLL